MTMDILLDGHLHKLHDKCKSSLFLPQRITYPETRTRSGRNDCHEGGKAIFENIYSYGCGACTKCSYLIIKETEVDGKVSLGTAYI